MDNQPAAPAVVKVVAPWSERIVAYLESFQRYPYAHSYTCGDCRAELVPTVDGWICRAPGCSYKQDWASVPGWLLEPMHTPARRGGE